MKRHLAYLLYVLRHKWFLLRAGRRLGVPILQLLRHDLSKLRPSEWGPYAQAFYDEEGAPRKLELPEFDRAWARHVHRNPHHWQHWVTPTGRGPEVRVLPMPARYALEMVADWLAAARAKRGSWAARPWYEARRDRILLHDETRVLVEALLRWAETKVR